MPNNSYKTLYSLRILNVQNELHLTILPDNGNISKLTYLQLTLSLYLLP